MALVILSQPAKESCLEWIRQAAMTDYRVWRRGGSKVTVDFEIWDPAQRGRPKAGFAPLSAAGQPGVPDPAWA